MSMLTNEYTEQEFPYFIVEYFYICYNHRLAYDNAEFQIPSFEYLELFNHLLSK